MDADLSFVCEMNRVIKGRGFDDVEHTEVAISRCSDCARIHRHYKRCSFAIGFAISLPVAAFLVLWRWQWNKSVCNTLAIIGIVLFIGIWYLGNIINSLCFESRVIPNKHGIKSEGDVYEAEVIRNKEQKGWVLDVDWM
jgi:hypothetical protein